MTFPSSILLFSILVGSIAAVVFQFMYIPLSTGLGLTVTFFWGFFLLLFEVPAGAIAGVIVALVRIGVNAALPTRTRSQYRGVIAGVCILCLIAYALPVQGGTLASRLSGAKRCEHLLIETVSLAGQLAGDGISQRRGEIIDKTVRAAQRMERLVRVRVSGWTIKVGVDGSRFILRTPRLLYRTLSD